MALKIRLRAQGRNNRPFFRLVLTDARAPRDGKYIEALGWYNPFESELDKCLSVKADRIQHWLNTGAELSERAETLVAKVAPALVRAKQDKAIQHKTKLCTKRKVRRRKNADKTK